MMNIVPRKINSSPKASLNNTGTPLWKSLAAGCRALRLYGNLAIF
jgi:hypothetical protein